MSEQKLYPNSFQVHNFYVDKCLHLLDGSEIKVLLYLLRRIIGFNKQFDRVSLTQFESGIVNEHGDILDNGVGLSRPSIVKALSELSKSRLIIELESSNNPKRGNAYTLEFDYSKVNLSYLENRQSNNTSKKSLLVKNLYQLNNLTSKKSLLVTQNTENVENQYNNNNINDLADLERFTSKKSLLVKKVNTQNSVREEEERRIRDIANLAVCAPTQENLFPSQSENLSDNSTQNSTQKTSQKAESKSSGAGKKESIADPRFNHPGLVAIREIIAESGSKEFPNKLVWDDLITVLGDNPDTAKLRQCAKAWLLKDYRIGNLAWVTEWYKNGIPLADWKKQQQTTSASGTTNQQPQQQPVPTCKEQITDRDAFIAFSNTEQFKNNPDALFDLIINAPVNLVAYCLFNPLPKDSIAKLPEAHKAVYESSKRGYLNYARTYAPKTYAQVVNY